MHSRFKPLAAHLARFWMLGCWAAASVAQVPSVPAQHVHAATTVRAATPFDTSTWATLMRNGPRPAAYVFSTTYCSTCPMAFEAIDQAVHARGPRVEVAAVLMDAQGPQALGHLRHYRGVTRAYAFDGFEPEIRYSVDPQWRNITPYVVLVDRQGALQRFTGQPRPEQLQTWLR